MDAQPTQIETEEDTLRDREMARILTGSEIPEREELESVARYIVRRAEEEGSDPIEFAIDQGLGSAPLQVALEQAIQEINSESK